MYKQYMFFLHPTAVFFCMHPTLEPSDVPERLSVPVGIAAPVLEAWHCLQTLMHL